MINIFQPCLGKEELRAVERVFKSNWIGKGKEVSEFEKRFAQSLDMGHEHFTSTTCCTEGIFAAPELFGCGKGTEIIVPTISFGAVGNAVVASGAKMVMCDVDPHTLNVRREDIEEVVGIDTKMVYVTHYGGVPCDMDPILELCKEEGIVVIEDSACAPCSRYKGRACGTMGDMGVWSFDPMKELVTGDGGMIYLRNSELVERVKENLYLGLPGKSKSGIDSTNHDAWWEFEVNRPGRRAIMNDIAGAIGMEQLRKLPQFIERRKWVDKMYREGLGDCDWLKICPDVPANCTSSYYMFWIQTEYRNKLARYLLDRGIYTTFRYWPLHKIEFFGATTGFINADFAAEFTLNLPIHQSLTDEEVEYVVDTIKAFHG